MGKLKINVKYFNKKCKLEKIEKGDWIDVRSAQSYDYIAGDVMVVPLGFALQLPAGYEAHLKPRSSTFKNYHVLQTNGVGVIDESYRGDNDQWFMPLVAIRAGKIAEGDRIGQFRIVEKMPDVHFNEVDTFNSADRGGLGSTGVK